MGVKCPVGVLVAAMCLVTFGAEYVEVQVVQQSPNSTELTVAVSGLDTSVVEAEGHEFTRLSALGAYPAMLDTGCPEVLMVPVLVAIPTGENPGHSPLYAPPIPV